MNDLKNITKQLRKGALDFIVLSTLVDTPKYPRAIIEELEQHGLSIVEGTIYPLFLRLYKNKFVKYEWHEAMGHPRKYYSLTKRGHAVLEQYMQEWQTLNSVLTHLNQDLNA